MQAVLDLGVFQFAEIAVDGKDKFAEIVGAGIDAQIAVEFGLLRQFPDLGFQYGQLGRVEGLGLIMFVHQLLEAGDVAVAVGGGHCRDQVVNDGGVGAALGLGSLAGVVDDERVEQWHIVQSHFGVAGGRQADAFAGQPFQSAVLAHVNDGVGAENIPNPAVIGDIVVRRGQVGAVIDGDGVFAETARRLQSHEHIAQV